MTKYFILADQANVIYYLSRELYVSRIPILGASCSTLQSQFNFKETYFNNI